MNKIILLIRPNDLQVLNESISYQEIASIPIYSFNIEAAEIALKSNLKNVKVITSKSSFDVHPNIAHTIADRLAREFDYESAATKKIYFNLDNNYNGWEYLNFYYFKYTQVRYKLIINELINFLPEAEEVIIVWNDKPQDYYFDSKILRSIVVVELNKKYKNITGYKSRSDYLFKDSAFHNSFIMPDGQFDRIVNLPATFYDYSKNLNRIKNERVLDLQSPYFDMKYSQKRGVLGKLIEFDDVKYSNYKKHYLKLINSALDVLDDNTRLVQSNRFYERSIFQLENFISLSALKCIDKIKAIDMTDIDLGLQGPIFSLAEKYSIEVNYWPHSKTTGSVLPVSEKIKVNKYYSLHNTMEMESFGKIGFGNFNHIEKIEKIEKIKFINKKNNVLIIHNEMDDVAGFPLVNIENFTTDYTNLIIYLKTLGCEIRSRQKPSHSYECQIPKIIEEMPGPLDSFIDWPNLCISIGTPTTAMINFWEKNIFCIHLTYYKLTEIDKSTLPENVKIIDLMDPLWLENFKEYLINKTTGDW
jgi:hypothetical protein